MVLSAICKQRQHDYHGFLLSLHPIIPRNVGTGGYPFDYIGVPSLLVIRGIWIVRQAPSGLQTELSLPKGNGGGRDLVVLVHHHF